ncbi:MAG: winged helix DNA-binding protein [Candidatus Limnocylindrus sp.]
MSHSTKRRGNSKCAGVDGSAWIEVDALLLLRRGAIGLFAIQALHKLSRLEVSRIARAMQRRGWVKLEPDPEDRRARRMVLTPSGRAHADRLSEVRCDGSDAVQITLPANLATRLAKRLVHRTATHPLQADDADLLQALLAGVPK